MFNRLKSVFATNFWNSYWKAYNLVKPGNVIKIKSLDNYYQDSDELLLHSSFQILCNFVEKELTIEDEIDKRFKKVYDLYFWWKDKNCRGLSEIDYELEILQKDWVPYHFIYDQIIKMTEMQDNTENPVKLKRYKKLIIKRCNLETKLYKEDTKKLKELMEIRGILWT